MYKAEKAINDAITTVLERWGMPLDRWKEVDRTSFLTEMRDEMDKALESQDCMVANYSEIDGG